MSKIVIPAGYKPALDLYQTQTAIGTAKRLFEDHLSGALNLRRHRSSIRWPSGNGWRCTNTDFRPARGCTPT